MNRFLAFILFVGLTFAISAQSTHEEIIWNTSFVNPFNQEIQESFKGASYTQKWGDVPFYSISIPIQTSNASFQIENMQFEPFNGSLKNKTLLQNEVLFTSKIEFQKKQAFLTISAFPLQINSFTGQVEKLVSFDVRINSITSYNPKGAKVLKTNSALGTGQWYKIAVAADGIYKIDKAFLSSNGINGTINFSNFGVFGQAMGILPEANSADRTDDIEEIPLKIKDHNNNGVWDADDYVLFYGKGPNLWHYNKVTNTWTHTINIYSDLSGYFISTTQGSGLSIPNVASTTGSNQTASTFDFLGLFEEEINNLIYSELTSTMGSGREWYGKRLTNYENSQSFSINVPNIVSSVPATVVMKVAASSINGSTFTLSNNGSTIITMYTNGINQNDFPNAATGSIKTSAVNLSGTNNFQFNFQNSTDLQSAGFLDYVQLNAQAQLKLDDSYLLFRNTSTVDTGNVTNFTLSNCNTNTEIWDVTSGIEPKRINGTLNGSQYQFSVATDGLKEFVAVNIAATNFPSPSFIGNVANQNLHSIGQHDMFIIAYKDFLSAAEKLAAFHRNEGKTVVVVDPEQIYNEFSSGMQDLTAIRDFIKMFYDRANNFATMPKYVLLLGDASFDYKNRVDRFENFVPTYESPESFSQVSSYCTDDFIGFLDDNEGFDITNTSNPNKIDVAVGRLPVDNADEANAIVDKIINYNTVNTQEDWRNNLTFVADDQDNNLHFKQVEELTALNTIEKYDYYNFDKIYLDAYSQANGAGGDRYPDVNDAILRKLRTGTFLMNYTGHGGPRNWAQERIFNIEDIRLLENGDKLPLFITATCDFSAYDDVDFHSAGETLITNNKGGAIALITTTRLVFANENKVMNAGVLDYLFQNYQGRMPTVGEILMEAKNGTAATENNRKFVLLGDPAMTLAYPVHEVVTTKINGQSIATLDTLKALSLARVEGEVRDANGNLMTGYNGIVYPTVFDKKTTYQTKGQDSDSQQANFELQNNVLFKGKASVVNGKFSFEFIVPKDINYAIGKGKISYYASNNAMYNDAHGFTREFFVGGSTTNATADDKGPDVNVFMNDTTFTFGGLTDENPILLVKLYDESGINTVGNGVGHDIVGLLNENTQEQYVLNDYYEATLDNYKSGSIDYPFNKLEDGRYKVRVKAWDVNNNPGEGYTEFVVASSAEMALQNVFNYPNPFTTHTSFIFEHNRPGELLDVQVQIFTIGGRLVKTINQSIISDGYRVNPDEITWNGLDDYGDAIGRGVYIYKVNVFSESGFSAQEFEKLVILR